MQSSKQIDTAILTCNLFTAIEEKNISKIRSLIAEGADLSAENKDKQTPMQYALCLAYASRDWQSVEAIATCKKTDDGDHFRYGNGLNSLINHGQFKIVKCLLMAGASPNWYRVKDECTPLHSAVKENNTEIIELLIKHHANLATQNKDKKTPIQLAAELGHWDCVETIATTKSSEEAGSKANYGGAIYLAVSKDELKTVEVLLKAQAPITWSSIKTGNWCLHEAVINNNPKIVAMLLKSGADSHEKNKAEQTPLELACALGNWESAEVFTQNKIFKFKDSSKAGIAFIAAIKAGQLNIAKYLMNADASTTEQTQDEGYTALHYAVSENNVKAVRFLLANNASQAVLSKNEETPVELAARLGYWDSVQALIEFDNTMNENVLLYAIKQSNFAITKLLLDHGALTNQWNSELGNIVLYWAVKNNENNPDIVSLLLQYKADPTIKNAAAETTEDLARKLGHSACLQHLQSYQENIQSNIFRLLKATPLAPESLEKLRNDAGFLYQSLSENALKTERLPDAIKELNNLHQRILENDRARLVEHRNKLQATSFGQTNYLTQSFNIHSELERLKTVIHTINTLLNYPNQQLQLNYILNPNAIEENDIQIYLNHKQCIDDYVLRLHIFLAEIKVEVARWKGKNFFDIWVKNKPEPIQKIYNELEKLSKTPSTDAILDAYKKVRPLLMLS